ncbi:hypothetical protein ABT104_11085 [Streptomyces mobaraensis]
MRTHRWSRAAPDPPAYHAPPADPADGRRLGLDLDLDLDLDLRRYAD